MQFFGRWNVSYIGSCTSCTCVQLSTLYIMDQDLKLVMYPIPSTIGERGPGSVLFVLGILFVSKFAISICGRVKICLDIYLKSLLFICTSLQGLECCIILTLEKLCLNKVFGLA